MYWSQDHKLFFRFKNHLSLTCRDLEVEGRWRIIEGLRDKKKLRNQRTQSLKFRRKLEFI